MPKGRTGLIRLTGHTFNVDPRGEEFAPLTRQWDIEPGESEWQLPKECSYQAPNPEGAPRFEVFVDGVQRTVIVGRFKAAGFSHIPLHAFEVAAGFVWRDRERRVRPGGWVRIRGLVAPFAVAFDDDAYAEALANDLDDAVGVKTATSKHLGEDPLLPLREADRVYVLDSSLVGIGGSKDPQRLLQKPGDLANEGRVRQLALAKVAHMRQLLELGAHLAIRRARLPKPPQLTGTLVPDWPLEDPWAMHDGPLFYSSRRRSMTADALGVAPERLDEAMLSKTVGYVKSHRIRPGDLECVLNTPVGHLTPVASHEAIEPPDRHVDLAVSDEEDRRYALSVYSFYLRMVPEATLKKARRSGTSLVRVQFGAPALNALGEDQALKAGRRLADAVLFERFPFPPRRFQPYSMYALETFLRGKLSHPTRIQHRSASWFETEGRT